MADKYAEILAGLNYSPQWSVASLAKQDDLVLFYRIRPEGLIRDLFRIVGKVFVTEGKWRKSPRTSKDYAAPIRRVMRLDSPMHYEDFLRHSVLKAAPFMRGRMQGRPNVTEYSPYIYDMIIRRNRTARRALRSYEPK